MTSHNPSSRKLPDPDSVEYRIAVQIARSRFGPGVDAGGAHNPRPSEWRMARDIVQQVRNDTLDDVLAECDINGDLHGADRTIEALRNAT